ncbi:MAG: glutaredoxin family protein [Solirubrobacteraceae bacterium]
MTCSRDAIAQNGPEAAQNSQAAQNSPEAGIGGDVPGSGEGSGSVEADGVGESAHRIVVYTTDRCPYCVRAKRLLDSKGLRYEEINLGRDPEGRMKLAGKTGMMTFPQILIDGALVGGFEETAAAAATGHLDELLAA